VSDAFAAGVLLPAVRANTSLRTLVTHAQYEPQLDAALEAEVLVKSRRARGGAASVMSERVTMRFGEWR
jgi:hypothetical protein